MPKLQTSCSTPVKDGMVVYTQTDRVKDAQNAVVEFLLVNHPLDCPVCDKGGECPLQDITFGWGPGRSRFVEDKRNFPKPIALSPLIAIDRERCILCYRCVRFSQEVAEDYQLVFLERGDHTFVGTHDGRPYVGPFSGNIIELCPVGALTSRAYRFRARPWDVEDSGSLCLLCPSQCNVKFTIRDDAKVLRVLARDNPEVDDGWLCDKGRFGYQAFHAPERITAPMVRDGGALREVSWERALSDAAAALEKAGEGAAGLAGGEATNEEGFLLQHLIRKGCGSARVDSLAGAALEPGAARRLANPELSARTTALDDADAILVVEAELVDEAPILDLRVRKAVRRNGARVVTLTSRPSSLDPNAAAAVRFAPEAAEAALAGLASGLAGPSATVDQVARRAGADPAALVAATELLRGAESVVVLWGDRISRGERGAETVAVLLAVAGVFGAKLIEVPAGANGRGLREVGCAPGLGPGLSDADGPTDGAGDSAALVLLQAEPSASALESAGSVIAFAGFRSEALDEHADVIFPAESHAEKEGTVTHPDGRLQRVREAVGRPGEVRPGWQVLAELCSRLGAGVDVLTAPMVTAELAKAAGIYEGITLEEIGGTGVRWQERDAASKLPGTDDVHTEASLDTLPELPGGMRLGTAPSLWEGDATRHSPALRFLEPQPRAELSPADAKRLGVGPGDEVVISSNGSSVRAVAALRSGVQPGSVFLVGADPLPRSVEVAKA